MKICQLCHRRLTEKFNWLFFIKNEKPLAFCDNCLKNEELIQNIHHDYITLNYYHYRYFLSAVLNQRYVLQNATILTVGYQRSHLNLYDETYAICELITSNCFSLTPTKLSNEKFLTDIRTLNLKKPLYVVSYNGLPKSIKKMLKDITYQHIALIE